MTVSDTILGEGKIDYGAATILQNEGGGRGGRGRRDWKKPPTLKSQFVTIWVPVCIIVLRSFPLACLSEEADAVAAVGEEVFQGRLDLVACRGDESDVATFDALQLG